MVRFLILRPIAVTMTFIAIMALGCLAVIYLPVSLMPDIEVPKLTVQVLKKNSSAREIENTLLYPLRNQLLQVPHLNDVSSEAKDGKGTINLIFEYGTDVDLAFIEVNEKIDQAMSSFPREIERPKVIKAIVTDIPVFYLNLSLKSNLTGNQQKKSTKTARASNLSSTLFPVSQGFVELSNFSTQVIKKRLEQLPEVAMVDLSGSVNSELLIIPDFRKLQAFNIGLDQLENVIKSNNLNLGNLLIHDGQYQYNIRFNSILTNKNEIADLYLNVANRIFQLKDVAEVIEHPQKRRGMVVSDSKDAITMAIIKQRDVKMGDLKEHLNKLIGNLKKDYPYIEFTVVRDQTQLLDYSIANLNQNIVWGGILAFLVMFVFLKDYKSPVLIGITLPASLILSLTFFYLFNISINIISLSGLVLGIGMMIDNSIIVIDNIAQYRESKIHLLDACVKGANDVFSPMVGSVLTTCAVFVPLIKISGISGALFYDEAMSIVIGSFVSLLISVTLIPVFYYLFYLKGGNGSSSWLNKINTLNYESLYEKSFKIVLRHQKLSWSVVLILTLVGIWLFFNLPRSKFPIITKEDTILAIDWNERINVGENNSRLQSLISQFDKELSQNTCWIGEQQFLLNISADLGSAEALVYLKVREPYLLDTVRNRMSMLVKKNFPSAIFEFHDADNIFNFIFSENEFPLTARLRFTKELGSEKLHLLRNIIKEIQQVFPNNYIQELPLREHLVLRPDPYKLVLFNISPDALYGKLKNSFNSREILLVADNQDFIPVILGEKQMFLHEILSNSFVENKDGKMYPIRELVSVDKDFDLKNISAGKGGEYYPIHLDVNENELSLVIEKVKDILKSDGNFEADFTGVIFANQKLLKEMSIILIISVVLLYFILAAQFESLTLPLIVLIEIPIDIFAAFIFLKLFGDGINIMSLIGIIVMSGIIINDSILKIDTINRFIKEGNSVIKSLMLGGKRRLKPILMTSLTTCLAMIPMLFSPGLGSEIQKPLAVTLLGGMTIGTLVSLYFIPLCYYYLKVRKLKSPNLTKY